MAVNICAEELATNGIISVDCSQVCPDTHSVTNLYSNNPDISRRGFRTEHFVRPPIEITFRSKFTFDLNQLEIGLRLNDNKSDAFEITSSNDGITYQLIAKQFDCHSNDFFCIKNVCFRPNSTIDPKSMQLSNPSAALVMKCYKNCFKIKSIKIKIFKTKNSSIPCLSYLKIFAQPVRHTSKEILDKISEIFSKKSNQNIQRFSFYSSNDNDLNETNEHELSANKEKRKFESTDVCANDNVPEEFIDSITNEIMIDPILLPSGHSIDKTTLDKYLSEESKWLRAPSDPFTQLLFTSERQPKPNSILRQRIDTFLSEQCGHFSDERLESSKRRRIVGSNWLNSETLVSSKLVMSDVPEKARAQVKESTINANQLCVECLRSHPISEYSVLYKLFCNHLICRQKLTENIDRKSKTISCKQCKCETNTDCIIKLNRI